MAEDPIFEGLFDNITSASNTAGWQGDFVKSLNRGASELGVSARDLALAIGYETERTFDSAHKGKGLATGRFGLIQAGPEEAKTYGFDPSQTPAEQVESVVSYLKDRGLKPGMGLKDIYSTINAGRPGLYDRSDRPGETVETHVARMADPKGIYAKATDELLSGFTPVEAAKGDDSWLEGIELPEPTHEPPAETAPEGSVIAGAPFSQSGAQWGTGVDFMNKLLLGGGKPIMAGAQAGKQAIQEIEGGSTVREALQGVPDTYSQARDAYEGAQAQWAEENPGQDLGNMLLGATIPTVAALAYTKGRAAPLLEGSLTAMSPRLGPPVAKFLAGEAGAGGSGVGNALLQAGSRSVAGALEGAAAGGLQTNLTKNSTIEDMITGGAFGSVANPIMGVIAPKIGQLFNAAVTRPVATLAQKAKNMGIELTGPQLTRDLNVRKIGAKAGALGNEEQLGQYTRAVSKEFGEDSDVITKDVLDNAKNRIGKDFESVSKNITQNIGDTDFMRTLTHLRTQALNEFGDPKSPEYLAVKNWIGIMGRAAQNGLLDGETFRALTRSGSPFMRGLTNSQNPNLRHYGSQMYDALTNALGRNVPASTKEAWQTAKQQWSAMKQVEPIAEKSWPSGVLDPQNMGKLRGSNTGNLNDLAEIGQLLPKTTKTGGAKQPSAGGDLVGSFLDKLSPMAKLGGVAGVVGGAVHQAPQIMNQILANPGASLVAGGTALGGMVVNKYIQKLMNDPRYAEILIAKGLAQRAPSMPPGAAMIEAGQNSVIPLGTEVLNRE